MEHYAILELYYGFVGSEHDFVQQKVDSTHPRFEQINEELSDALEMESKGGSSLINMSKNNFCPTHKSAVALKDYYVNNIQGAEEYAKPNDVDEYEIGFKYCVKFDGWTVAKEDELLERLIASGHIPSSNQQLKDGLVGANIAENEGYPIIAKKSRLALMPQLIAEYALHLEFH